MGEIDVEQDSGGDGDGRYVVTLVPADVGRSTRAYIDVIRRACVRPGRGSNELP